MASRHIFSFCLCFCLCPSHSRLYRVCLSSLKPLSPSLSSPFPFLRPFVSRSTVAMAFLGTRSSHAACLHIPHKEKESLASLSECRARGARQLRLLAQHEEAARCCRRRSGRGCTCHGGVGSSGALGAGRAACKGKPRSSAARHAASRVHDPAPTLDRLPALCIPLVHLKMISMSHELYTDPNSCKDDESPEG